MRVPLESQDPINFMLNLLPEENKREIKIQYSLRLVAIVFFAVFVFSIYVGVASLPPFFLAYSKEIAITNEAKSLKQEIEEMKKDSSARVLKLSRQRLDSILSATTTPYVHDLIVSVIQNKPSSISITGFDTKFDKDGKGKTTIRGKASNRNALLTFSKSLEQSSYFASVLVPVANFAASTNLEFSIEATLK